MPACLLLPFGVAFVQKKIYCFDFGIKKPDSPAFEFSPSLSSRILTERISLRRTPQRIDLQGWVQRWGSSISARETRKLRSMPGTSWESLVDRRQRRPASWSSSGEAWPSLSNPGCLTGSQRSRWRTTSIWL